MHINCPAPADTAALARRFAKILPPPPLHLHLQGDVGAGKSLWARELIAGLGGGGAPSPTFALALSYTPAAMPVHHLDLFRLPEGAPLPDDLLELLQDNALCLIEWPARASGVPVADVLVQFDFYGDGRQLHFDARSKRGEACLRDFSC